MKWIGCRSGAGSPARERQKRWVWQAGRPGEGGPTSRSALKITGEAGGRGGSRRRRADPRRRRCRASVGDPQARSPRAAGVAQSRSCHRTRRRCSRSCARRARRATTRRPCTVPVEQQTPRDSAGDHVEVRVALDRADVGRHRAVTDAALDAELHERHAVLRVAVVVVVQRDAALLRRLGDRDVDRVRLERREEAHGPRPAGRAPLDALVHRPHVLPRPAVGAELSPPVEVRRGPRTQIIALRELDPPRTRPRGQASRRPLACACGTVS